MLQNLFRGFVRIFVTIHGFFQINKQIGLAIFSFLGHNIVNKVGVHKI